MIMDHCQKGNQVLPCLTDLMLLVFHMICDSLIPTNKRKLVMTFLCPWSHLRPAQMVTCNDSIHLETYVVDQR